MVDLLQSLFLKDKLTKHPVFWLDEEMELVAEELWQLKMRTFRASVIYPRSYKYHVQVTKLADLMNDKFLSSSGRNHAELCPACRV